ncbi:hypothetical protein COO60DRAFT_1642273 [Scenedesmus sp. NREL 46B-D3]|nr:hypothetical protein COO60DRAFT_1642273 [Scenedesmus sp. NREL 46B-D3]
MAFRGNNMDLLGGSAYIVWYFRALGCSIGRAVCLYPAGSDPMMNEPELVAIGDNACINHAFVVNHLNTKGDFTLQRIEIGPRTTLRAFSRLTAGSTVEEGAVMLEHTLAMPGETVDKCIAWQGWPVSSLVPVKVLRMQQARAAAPATPAATSAAAGAHESGTPGSGSAAGKAVTAAAPGACVADPQGVVSAVANMRLRNSLRISCNRETFEAAGLMQHLHSIEQSMGMTTTDMTACW